LKAIGEELSEIVSGSTASSPDIHVPIYVKARMYLSATLCKNLKAIGEQRSELGQSLKAIGEEVSEIVAGSTAS
jgi:hypothetical protein